MTAERSPLEAFDGSVFDDPEFKEDAVREEVISPLLKGLGFSTKGPDRIVRSRRLKHPFVRVGRTRKPVELIPDYLLVVRDLPGWVLEAKGPAEPADHPDVLEQAYSYAKHPEIRASLFAICNGRRLLAFDVDGKGPCLDVDPTASEAWPAIRAKLSPFAFAHRNYDMKQAEDDYSKFEATVRARMNSTKRNQ